MEMITISLLFPLLAFFIHPAPMVAYVPVSGPTPAAPTPQSALFAFGDSTLDSGNNNRIFSIFKANHPPYGRDFPAHIPTGRFTNGKLATDFIVCQLGIKDLLPAYSDPTLSDQDLLTGVSFASGGSGLDDLTAIEASVLPMSAQLNNFRQAIREMQASVGEEKAGRIVKDAIYLVGAGTNDMVFNFYGLPLRRNLGLLGYQDMLLANLEAFIRKLHYMGARRIAITGLPPIGCLPLQVSIGSLKPSPHMLQRVCVDYQNGDSKVYNTKLQALLARLQEAMPGSRIVYVDIYNPLMKMIRNPYDYGFTTTNDGCCGVGLGSIEMGPLCNPLVPMCPDPTKFLFYDAVHLTERAYSNLADAFLKNVYPYLCDRDV